LKLAVSYEAANRDEVAPCAGAWIETWVKP